MGLTDKQQKGLEISLERYKNEERYVSIVGYAGSGKSFLVKHIIAALADKYNINPEEDVAYAAFTGKAAKVLTQKGNPNAVTIHKLLYNNRQDSSGKYKRTLKKRIDYKVVVIDESSMVSEKMMKEMASFKEVFWILLGGAEQLSPVSGEINTVIKFPHVFLDEIMRQALDSEIIRLSMDIRNGKPLKRTIGKDVLVIDRKDINEEFLVKADQILCAKNSTRYKFNMLLRELKGLNYAPYTEKDKIICNKNYWDIGSSSGFPLTNGTIGSLGKFFDGIAWNPVKPVNVIWGDIKTENDGIYKSLPIDISSLVCGEDSLTDKEMYEINLECKKEKIDVDLPLSFSFAYALSVWKAQGSEWDNVVLFEEDFPFSKEEHRKYLYTGITRAAKKVILVKK